MIPPAGESASSAPSGGPLRPLDALILSVGFWACLGAAGAILAMVSLAPRLVERAALQQRFSERQSELLTLQREVARLEQVAGALAQDAPLMRSLARQELRDTPAATAMLPVTGGLRFDPRQPPPEPVDVPYVEPWYVPILAGLAADPQRQRNWCLLAAGLLLFGFVFLHEHAGSRAVAGALLTPLRWLRRRYCRHDASQDQPA